MIITIPARLTLALAFERQGLQNPSLTTLLCYVVSIGIVSIISISRLSPD